VSLTVSSTANRQRVVKNSVRPPALDHMVTGGNRRTATNDAHGAGRCELIVQGAQEAIHRFVDLCVTKSYFRFRADADSAVVKVSPSRECDRLQSTSASSARRARQGRARVVFTRLEPTRINRGGVARSYRSYSSMYTPGTCTRAMGDIGLTNFNSARQNTKSQNFAVLDLKNGAFGKLYLHQDHVGTSRKIDLSLFCMPMCTAGAGECGQVRPIRICRKLSVFRSLPV
jgi:hypothetical protein